MQHAVAHVSPAKLVFWISSGLGCLLYLRWFFTLKSSEISQFYKLVPLLAGLGLLYHDSKHDGGSAQRLLLSKLGIILLRGLKLTYNHFQKGSFNDQILDHSWIVTMLLAYKKWLGHIAAVAYFCLQKSFALGALVIPLARSEVRAFDSWDNFLTGFLLLFATVEIIADQQQVNFYAEQRKLIKGGNQKAANSDYRRGFLSRGLWRFSRNIDSFSEIGFWFCIYLYGAKDQSLLWNWKILPWVFMTLSTLLSMR